MQVGAAQIRAAQVGAVQVGATQVALGRLPECWRSPRWRSRSSTISLVERDVEARTASVHRMVQAVVRDGLDEEGKKTWAERVVKALDKVFPTGPGGPEFETWGLCERLYPQALAVAGHVERLAIELWKAAHLLTVAGVYAWRRSNYEEAEPLYQRALAIWEKALGPDHPDIGNSLNNLANLYADQGRYVRRSSSASEPSRSGRRPLAPTIPPSGIHWSASRTSTASRGA